MAPSWSDIGVDWVLLALRVAFIAVLYLFLWQVARLMLREIRAVAAPQAARTAPAATYATEDERGLVVIDPGDSGLEIGAYVPIAGEVMIGRSGESDLILTDPFISSEHAQLIVRSENTIFLDLGSTNGSKVNGEVVVGPVTLFDGDVVQLGSVRLRYAATIQRDRRS